jgi:anti-sigma B factor antagonist
VAEPRFSVESHDGCAVVAVHGELDVTSSQQLEECLTEASAGTGGIILDLSGVDFMDTTALAVIVSQWRRQVAADGMFLLAGARYRYTKALWITGLADRPDPGAETAPRGTRESGGSDATAAS